MAADVDLSRAARALDVSPTPHSVVVGGLGLVDDVIQVEATRRDVAKVASCVHNALGLQQNGNLYQY